MGLTWRVMRLKNSFKQFEFCFKTILDRDRLSTLSLVLTIKILLAGYKIVAPKEIVIHC
jgi:hypothetical protein